MTDRVGAIGARQIMPSRTALSEVVRNAEWNRRMSHGREDPYIVARDRDALLDAAQELLAVIDKHIRPQCPAIMGGTAAWRCSRPEGHEGSHGDSIMRW